MKEEICQCETTAEENRTTTVTLEIPVRLLKELQDAAALVGSDYQALLTCFAQQGLAESHGKLKREQFMEHAREILKKHGVQATVIEEISSKILF